MIDTAPSRIACWSEGGDTFIIKIPTEFADKIIPLYFKHSKFTSFVRQLNFYGFRKLKVDDPQNLHKENSWWEFQHDKFVRGKKELLKDIRRRTCSGSEGLNQMGREMASLKSEVKSLKEDMAEMKGSLDYLTQVVTELLSPNATKKRKSDCLECNEESRKPAPRDAPQPKRPTIDPASLASRSLKGPSAAAANVTSVSLTPSFIELDLPTLTPLPSMFQNEDIDAAFSLNTPKGYFQAIESH